MAWDYKFISFGIIKIKGPKVLVYKDQFNYTTISVGVLVLKAEWAGGVLEITLHDGTVRRYWQEDKFITM